MAGRNRRCWIGSIQMMLMLCLGVLAAETGIAAAAPERPGEGIGRIPAPDAIVRAQVLEIKSQHGANRAAITTELTLAVTDVLAGIASSPMMVRMHRPAELEVPVKSENAMLQVGDDVVVLLHRTNDGTFEVAGEGKGISRVNAGTRGDPGLYGGMAHGLRLADLLLPGFTPLSVAPVDSGIEGTATLGPATPSTRIGEPVEDRPFQTTLRVAKASDGTEVARFSTGTDGTFRVSLAPGDYLLGPVPSGPDAVERTGDRSVTVPPHAFVRITIAFDSGMR